MRATLSVASFALCLAAVPVWAQPSRDDRWRGDLQEMVRTAGSVHPNLFTQVSRDRFQQEFEALSAAIPQKTDVEMVLGFQRLLALAGDLHTSLSVFQTGSPVRRYSLRLYWFSDGIFVTDAGTPYLKALGRKLVRVGGLPVEEAVARLKPLISTENNWRVRSAAMNLLVSPDALAFAGVIPNASDPVPFTVVDAAGEFSLSLTPVAATLNSLPQRARPDPPLYRRYAERFYWFDYVESSQTFYIKYNAAQESPVLGMIDFLESMNRFADGRAMRRVVIDTRNNGGGSTAVTAPLLQAIAAALTAGALTRDQLFVVIGRDTLSSGMLGAIEFRRLGATLAGEPTGNRPNHFGNVLSYTLPGSGLVWSCSTKVFSFPEYPEDALLPDLPVELSSAEYFDERDPVLERIFQRGN